MRTLDKYKLKFNFKGKFEESFEVVEGALEMRIIIKMKI